MAVNEGYHYAATEDGTLVIEEDEPSEGAATISWTPLEFPTQRGTVVVPMTLLAKVALPYVKRYVKAAKAAKQKQTTAA